MAKLSEEQQRQLDELERLRDAPEADSGPGRAESVTVTIDLSDEKAVERGLQLGFLRESDVDDQGDDDSDDDDQGDDDSDDGGKPQGKSAPRGRKPPKDEPPRRGGYFDK